MSSRLDNALFDSIVVGADKLLPLSAMGVDGQPRFALGKGGAVPHLAYSAQSGLGRIVANVAARYQLSSVFTSHLAATLLSMVRAGDGLAWLPRTLAEDDVASGLLVHAGSERDEISIEIRLFRSAVRQRDDLERLWAAFDEAAR